MGADPRDEAERLLGAARGGRARWLLARLAGEDDAPVRPEALREMLGAAYRQPERLLPNLAFWRERLGAHRATAARLGGGGALEVELRDAKGRAWSFTCRIEAEPPHRIEFWSVRRPLPPGARLRRAAEPDAEAVAALERACPIERDDGSRVTLVRGRSLFDQARLAEWSGLWLVEQDGAPVACDARSVHVARVAGRDVRLLYRFHTRVSPSHRRLGLNETLVALISEELMRAGVVVDGVYVYVDPRNRVIRDWSPTPPWATRPLRALLRCDALAGPPAGRPATPADAPQIAAWLDAAHEGEALYRPSDAGRLADRLARAPGGYGFEHVWLDGSAVVGVWEDREQRVLERDGTRDESVRATVLDWGFAGGAPEGLRSLERLLRSWCVHLSGRGVTHLSVFFSHASPAARLLRRLAESVIEIELQSTLPEPSEARERGVHVDPVYY
jgi:hypothetical protein